MGRAAADGIDYQGRGPLDPDLHGPAHYRCTRADVQDARTVSEMIALSGVPREMWYAPPTVPKPTVSTEDRRLIVERVTTLRRRTGMSRAQLMTLLGLTSISAVHRMERGNVHVDEVATVRAALDRVGV